MSISYDALFQKIRINFLFNHPFLSVLALSIPTTYMQNEYSAFETNGLCITVDTQKLSRYTEDEIIYLYAHTLLHIVLKHPYRQKTREKEIWNISCDIVTNLVLATFSNIGSMPRDEVLDTDLQDKCVEEVYEILYKKQEEKQKYFNPEKMDIVDADVALPDQLDENNLDRVVIQALSIAKKSSHKYVGLQIEIDTLVKPEINLHDILKEYLIASLFEKTATYDRPNRKFLTQGLYLPGNKKSNELIEVYIALDSSSSVSLEEYKTFLGIIQEVCEGFYEYKITVLPFDVEVKQKHIVSFDSFNPLDENKLFIPKSDGGTNFDAVLQYLKTATEIRSNNLLMVLSDGEFEIYESLVCQTLFIISMEKNLKKFESYGRVIRFNI